MEDTELNQIGTFSIRVRKGDWAVEVSAPDKEFVLEESRRLIEEFKLAPVVIHQPLLVKAEEDTDGQISAGRPKKQQTVSEFFRQFKTLNNLEQILILGYWLESKQGGFTPDEVLEKFKEIKEQPPANIRRDLKNMVAKGWLLTSGKSEDGGSAYALTNTGEKEAEARRIQPQG